MSNFSKPLTSRQKDVLDYINGFLVSNGYAPSLKEIANHIGVDNLSTAQHFVRQLIQKGYLDKDPNVSRGITSKTPTPSVPLLGYIAAGKPIEPLENPEQILVPASIPLSPLYPHYALRVSGDSMMDMGILSGDIVLIRHQLTANQGDVVVAITENGATLKVYTKKNGQVVLEARNVSFKPIIPKQVEIRGKFIGLIRKV